MDLPADPETMMEEDLPMVQDGDTKLHNHPDAEFVTHVIAQFYTTPTKKRSMTWREFLLHLDDELDEPLPLDPTDEQDRSYVQRWCKNHVAVSWGLLPQDVKHDLIDIQDELNSAVQHHELYKTVLEDIEMSKEREEKVMKMLDELQNADGDEAEELASDIKSILSFTMSPSQRSKAAKRASNIVQNRDEELERWSLIPDKDDGGAQVNVKADSIDVSVSSSQDHLATGGRTVDAEGGVKDD